MVKSHYDALERVLAQERDLLLPILGSDTETYSGPASPAVFADVARLSAMIQDTFAGDANAGDPQNDTRLKDLLQVAVSEVSYWGAHNLASWDTKPEP